MAQQGGGFGAQGEGLGQRVARVRMAADEFVQGFVQHRKRVGIAAAQAREGECGANLEVVGLFAVASAGEMVFRGDENVERFGIAALRQQGEAELGFGPAQLAGVGGRESGAGALGHRRGLVEPAGVAIQQGEHGADAGADRVIGGQGASGDVQCGEACGIGLVETSQAEQGVGAAQVQPGLARFGSLRIER